MWHLDFASAFPQRILSAAEIAAMVGGDEAFIRDKVGIASRRFLSPGETPLDLALAAARAGLDKAGLVPSDLDWLIFVTQNPDFRLPQSSALLADGLGTRSDLAAFDLSLGCSGWVYALTLANAFARTESLGAGMIVTCDPYSRALDPTDRATLSVFGDAAAATVFRPGGPVRIGKGIFGTDGAGGMGLAAAGGGARRPLVSIDSGDLSDLEPGDCAIRMDGRAILDFMQTRVPDCVRDCLARNGAGDADVSAYVFHQASRYMLQLLTRRMDLDPAKVPIEIADTGNTVSSTIPITLERMQSRGDFSGRLLVCGFGVGLSWAANMLDIRN